MNAMDLRDVINRNEEILFENGEINAPLFLYDAEYIELISRSDMARAMVKGEGLTPYSAVCDENDVSVSAYANYYANGDVHLYLVVDGAHNYCDEDVPLRDEEKEQLWENLREVVQGMTISFEVDEVFDEVDKQFGILPEKTTVSGRLNIHDVDLQTLFMRIMVTDKSSEGLERLVQAFDDAVIVDTTFEINAMGQINLSLQVDDFCYYCQAPFTENEKIILLADSIRSCVLHKDKNIAATNKKPSTTISRD